MSCCSGGYCKFQFVEGPPLVDNAVQNLNANWQFLPYGTLLEEGEVVRLWTESGETQVVMLKKKIPLVFSEQGWRTFDGTENLDSLPWQLIAFDSGVDYDELMRWNEHPLYNPSETACLLRYQQPEKEPFSLKSWLLGLLYKFRNL